MSSGKRPVETPPLLPTAGGQPSGHCPTQDSPADLESIPGQERKKKKGKGKGKKKSKVRHRYELVEYQVSLAEKAATHTLVTRVPKGEMISLVASHDAIASVEWSDVICEKGERMS